MSASTTPQAETHLAGFHPAVQGWFREAFPAATPAQRQAWPAIAAGENTLLLAPTGSGKTLAAFMVAINRLMFGRPVAQPPPDVQPTESRGVSVIYISPLKALGVDVERNLRAPIAGVRNYAEREGHDHHVPTIGVRSGDTPSADRQRMVRQPPDILITTPESLFLMLTSRAREILTLADTVIVDEIHSLVLGKRGAHLFVSLERLERLRARARGDVQSLQRVGLSATQRPLQEVARLLGGGRGTADHEESPQPRPVTIVEAGRRKQLELKIEVPVEDMAQLAVPIERSGSASSGPTTPSIWPSIHPRLVELIQEHRSTMIFVNSRRLAERLANAINELAEAEIAAAHHGSIARDTRLSIEDRLKRGVLPAIVATSSLELGIDMGAVDLVIQIEAPPSIASGLQRIGRAGHQVGAPSKGVMFPKYRGDLLATAAAAERMIRGEVEETFYPRNPLDILAQQLVAMVALEPQPVDELFATVRGAAPFFELPRTAFDGVLDLLAGRYPSDEFAELRPRLTWDRITGTVSPRKGSQRIAIANGGTIPDRGLYGVFLADGGNEATTRVGELDEEMVFETRPGDVFLLGASSWRAVEITHDRVLVVPAPGEPGKMPFWRGDGPGRPLEFGQAIGTLTRSLLRSDRDAAHRKLVDEHALDTRAATNLLNYLHDQAEVTGDAPSDTTIVIESFVDEVGDWRVVVMTPFGGRVHAPWAMAAAARLRSEVPGEVDLMWSDDGMVFRLPESDAPPPPEVFLPSADEVEDIVVREVGTTALFASHFRENAGRALLLPKRQPGRRTPLWIQRRKAADLLQVVSRYERFPILLETYRECLRDVLDLGGLKTILQGIEQQQIRVQPVETTTPSPFAASLMFNYTANFLYEGDAPLAERRAATLALDHTQLRELLGDAELRELLDADSFQELAIELQRLDGKYPVRDVDELHELLRGLGDLTRVELAARCEARAALPGGDLDAWIEQLTSTRRIVPVRVAGEDRFIAAEDAGRYRDAVGVVPPPGLPEAFLAAVEGPLEDIVSRFARTHVAFKAEQVADRLGIGVGPITTALKQLHTADRVLEGEFSPGGRGREWCDAEVLRKLKRRSLARLRKQVEPVEPDALGRLLVEWQGIARPRRGLDGLLDVMEQLQGIALPASVWEQQVLPARIEAYRPSDLDELCLAGEVVWRGHDSLGAHDGRIAFYLTDHVACLAPAATDPDDVLEQAIVRLLTDRGAILFEAIHRELGGFRNDTFDALWRLVWAGIATNDTLAPLRARLRQSEPASKKRRSRRSQFRSRRAERTPGAEGRWSLLRPHGTETTATERLTAIATQLIERYGVVTRNVVAAENVPGGFAGIYPVFKAMEEAGRVRRGYFIAGQGGAQFAAAGADDRLRDRNPPGTEPNTYVLAATDPANPYGAALPWPATASDARPQRAAAARVILWDGRLIGYLNRTGKHLLTLRSGNDPHDAKASAALVTALAAEASPHKPLYLQQIDGRPPEESDLAAPLLEAGFDALSGGLLGRGRADEGPRPS